MKQTTGDIYRHENFFNTEEEAFEDARLRSLKTNKLISVMVNSFGGYQTNSHGVESKEWTSIAVFHKGTGTKLEIDQVNKTNMKETQELPALLPNNEIILKDAVSLLKNDFVELYAAIGYERSKVGIAWHTLRASPKGVDMRLKVKGMSVLHKDSIKEEAQERKNLLFNVKQEPKMEKVVSKEETSEQGEGSAVKPEKEKPVKVKKEKPVKAEKPEGDGTKRKKGALKGEIVALIEAGETDWKVLVEKTGSSQHFAKWLLKQSKKTGVVAE